MFDFLGSLQYESIPGVSKFKTSSLRQKLSSRKWGKAGVYPDDYIMIFQTDEKYHG